MERRSALLLLAGCQQPSVLQSKAPGIIFDTVHRYLSLSNFPFRFTMFL
jgi:hypothetical protein